MSGSYLTSIILFILITCLAAGSLLNLSSSPHWFVRGWDFPRVQIVVTGWLLVLAYGILRWFAGDSSVLPLWPFLAFAAFLTAWHGFRILPYTPLMSKQSVGTPLELIASHRNDDSTIRIVMSNVEMENDRYDLWVQRMRSVDPDILLVVEIDEAWVNALEEFIEGYQYQVIEPQDNWYGMMTLSRLPILESKVRYLVQEDVPSIDASIRLDNDSTIRFVGVHPRPPEPVRGENATARDAELMLWGRELAEEKGPIIIGGDLNDVAWSRTTRLFLRTSGLLDPRRGRGFFNTFHVGHPYMRFPLDHVFHSKHFTINELRRLSDVGSDHFPILIALRHAPSKKSDQQQLPEEATDEQKIETRVERAVEDEDLQGEAVDNGTHEEIKEVDKSPSAETAS